MQKSPKRRFPASFSKVLIVGIITGFAILYVASVSASAGVQTILLLISMALIFFTSHPLAHYLAGLIYGVDTKYFFISTSEFRKLGGFLGSLGKTIPTIGVKFQTSQVASIGKLRRSFLFGSGVIVSNVIMGVLVSLAFVLGFSLVASALGMLFLLASLATEFLFSTKVGDLYKMKRELSSV